MKFWMGFGIALMAFGIASYFFYRHCQRRTDFTFQVKYVNGRIETYMDGVRISSIKDEKGGGYVGSMAIAQNH